MNAEQRRELEEAILGLTLGEHLCLLYESTDEQLASAVPYVRAGLRRGERCVYIVDDRSADELTSALHAADVEVAREMDRGALTILTKRDSYLRDGTFDPECMIALLRRAQDDALGDGFAGLCVTGEMTWALGPEAGTDRLIEYEARLNDFFPGSKALALCQYNVARFPPALTREVLRTHPVAVLGHQVCPNLYYESPAAVLGTVSDAEHVEWMIGQLKRAHAAEYAVQRSEQQYRSLIEHAPYGVYRSTAEGKFLSVNPAMVEMLGYDTESELVDIDMSADLYADPEERHRLIELFGDASQIDNVEVQWKRKDGRPITVRLKGRTMRTDGDRLECFEVFAEDVTAQRVMEEQFRQAQKMEAIGQLTGGLAHDFNNLLTIILSNVDLVLASLPLEAEQIRADLVDVRAAAKRGSMMVQKLLAFSRRNHFAFRSVRLHELLQELEKVLRRLLSERIEITLAPVMDVGVVSADPGAVEQILLNLATNARDAMPNGGSFTISLRRESLAGGYHATHPWVVPGEYACIEVADTGVGMDEATRSQIFEPFFTTKAPGKGTGLGMAMIYGIVKRHRGFVHVYSEVGHGTVVKVYFPIVQEEEQPAAEALQTSLPVGSETILVAEDEEGIRRATRRALEARGYRVLLARDGEEAFEVLEAHEDEIDLILADLVMPKLGGRQLLHALREKGKRTRMLFMSGYSKEEFDARPEPPADMQLLRKPWTLEELAVKVRDALDAPGPRRRRRRPRR